MIHSLFVKCNSLGSDLVWRGSEAAAFGGTMRGVAVNILNKKFDFMHSTDFKLLSQIKGNPLSD
jgi:hypothetical protein